MLIGLFLGKLIYSRPSVEQPSPAMQLNLDLKENGDFSMFDIGEAVENEIPMDETRPYLKTDDARVRISSMAEEHADSRADFWAEKYAGEYESRLKLLGVDTDQIPRILEHRIQLVELSSLDKVIRQRMQSERMKHLEMVESNMTPEAFADYKEGEKIKGGDREFTRMAESGHRGFEALNSEEQLMLKSLMVDHDLLTTEAWDGPLDPLPNPLVGVERVSKHKLSRMERISNNLPGLLSELRNLGFDELATRDVEDYYRQVLIGMENGYKRLTTPDNRSLREIINEMKQRVFEANQKAKHEQATSERIQNQFKAVTGSSGN